MSVTPRVGVKWIPDSSRQQQPSISDHVPDASCASVWSGSPRIATSQFNFLKVAPGVAEGCGPIATFTASPPSSANHFCGTRNAGGGQRQKRYEGAVGITRKSG